MEEEVIDAVEETPPATETETVTVEETPAAETEVVAGEETEAAANVIIQGDSIAEVTIPEDPQRFYSIFSTDDYAITIVHDITLGDVLLATLLCVLIIAVVLGRVIGGVRR